MLFETHIKDNFIYLLDNYWCKAYFGGFTPGNMEGLKTQGIDIPRQISYDGRDYEVIEILNSALVCTYDLTFITIPDSIRRIGEYSLHRCSNKLKELVLPNSIKNIGEHAFDGCAALERVVLPQNLDIIPSHCFYSCGSLLNIVLPKKLLKIGDFAFYACEGLTNIDLPDSIVEIGNCAFAFCYGVKSFTLPKKLQYININTFLQNPQIEKIISLNPTPPTIIKSKYDKFAINHYFKEAKLYVPKGSEHTYRNAEEWKEFKEIIGI